MTRRKTAPAAADQAAAVAAYLLEHPEFLADHPEMNVISNIKENGKDIGHADAGWQTQFQQTAHQYRPNGIVTA